jgi:hypothetical protein
MRALQYPTVEQVIAYNELTLARFRVKKADRHDVRDAAAIQRRTTRRASERKS